MCCLGGSCSSPTPVLQITRDIFLQSSPQYARTLSYDRILIVSATIVTFCESLIKVNLQNSLVRLAKDRYFIFIMLIERMQLTGFDFLTQTPTSNQLGDQNLGLTVFLLYCLSPCSKFKPRLHIGTSPIAN